MTKIVRLEAENIKRLRAIEITPEGNVVVVGGKNGQGKSSTLDAIWYALGGKGAMPSEPLRQGEDAGFTKLTLDNGITVTRRINDKGTTLKVESDKGAVFTSPQTMLDEMVGAISFDPMAFARMEPKAQQETLRGLVGLDLSKLENEHDGVYAERTVVNRAVKQLEDQIAGIQSVPNVPAEEVSVAQLMEELGDAEAVHMSHDVAMTDIANTGTSITARQLRIEALKNEIVDLKSENEDEKARLKLLKAVAAKTKLPDVVALRTRISEADAVNEKVRQKQRRTELQGSLKRGKAKQKQMTKKLADLDATIHKQIAAAKFPVKGLKFAVNGVRFNDVPFEQCSSAEQTRVSVGMALAMSPELRVLLIRDGSLLDEDSFALIAEMAKKADAQIWIETVSTDEDQCTVIIEDGAVR